MEPVGILKLYTHQCWVISEEERFVGQEVGENTEIVLPKLDDLVLGVNPDTVGLRLLHPLQTKNDYQNIYEKINY